MQLTFLQCLLKENANHVVIQSFNRRKSIRSEVEFVLMPQSRIFWLQNKAAILILSPSASSGDEESLRQLLNDTDNFKEAVVSRYVAQDSRILLKVTNES